MKRSDLLGPLLYERLPADLIERIKAYKEILGETDPGSMDDAIDSFRRDLDPERQVAMWEHVARVFQAFMAVRHQMVDVARRRAVLRALLVLSSGADVSELPGPLSRAELAELTHIFEHVPR